MFLPAQGQDQAVSARKNVAYLKWSTSSLGAASGTFQCACSKNWNAFPEHFYKGIYVIS